jgi:hypothetical protein
MKNKSLIGLLLASSLLLLPTKSNAQIVILPAPINTGGVFTGPLLGPTTCTAMAYSFVGDTVTGLCQNGVGNVIIGRTGFESFLVNTGSSTFGSSNTAGSLSMITGRTGAMGFGDMTRLTSGSTATDGLFGITNNAGTSGITFDLTTNGTWKCRDRTNAADCTATVGALQTSAKLTSYNSVTTAGWGLSAICASARSNAQTAAVASVAACTNTAADGSYDISCNVLVTTATSHSFGCRVDYTDEGNTARSILLDFATPSGFPGGAAAIVNTNGAVPYAGTVRHLRVKASTSITILTVGTFTTVTYNVEGIIRRVS